MDNVNMLLEEKYSLLESVFELCNELTYTSNKEENIRTYIDFYEQRTPIFERIKDIDEEVIAHTSDDSKITNDKIKAISKKIIAFDENNRKNEDEFSNLLTKEMKKINQGIKVNKKFNNYSYGQSKELDLQG